MVGAYVYMEGMKIAANFLANYGVFAPGLIQSRFSRMGFYDALVTGLSIGYGWSNYIEDCRFESNGIGLHTYNGGNNIDVVDSAFEGNTEIGFYAAAVSQISISGCVLEGNGGAGVKGVLAVQSHDSSL